MKIPLRRLPQLGYQPASILDLVTPPSKRFDSQLLPILLQSSPPFIFPIPNLLHHPLPREILICPSRTMSHPVQLSLTNQRLDRLQTKHLQQLALPDIDPLSPYQRSDDCIIAAGQIMERPRDVKAVRYTQPTLRCKRKVRSQTDFTPPPDWNPYGMCV